MPIAPVVPETESVWLLSRIILRVVCSIYFPNPKGTMPPERGALIIMFFRVRIRGVEILGLATRFAGAGPMAGPFGPAGASEGAFMLVLNHQTLGYLNPAVC